MKIIKKGEIHHGYYGRWQCQKCECVWELGQGDPEPAIMIDQRDGNAHHMPCPTCKNETYRNPSRRITAEDYYNK